MLIRRIYRQIAQSTPKNIFEIQNYLRNNRFLEEFVPRDVKACLTLPDSGSNIGKKFREYSKVNSGLYESPEIDMEGLNQILFQPLWDVINRPSKLIRASFVYNFNKLAGLQNEDYVLHLAAFIEVVHSLTLIIGLLLI